ncbi:hypothetical protein KX816_19015 [Sphingosinicellaceae bacterium]|nr:hypothetical protein KX816_19015 [Sphingosinicellaceae bacterium]
MDVRSKGALAVIAVITAVVVVVVRAGIDTWRTRSNPSVTNQGPSNQPMQSRPPA